MRLTVLGPSMTSKHSWHVHRAECSDLQNRTNRARVDRGEADTVDMPDKRAVVAFVYPPKEYGYDATEWRDTYGEDVKFFPCCAPLPDEADDYTLQEFADRFTLPEGAEQVEYVAQALAFLRCDVDLGEDLNGKVDALFGDLYEHLTERGTE